MYMTKVLQSQAVNRCIAMRCFWTIVGDLWEHLGVEGGSFVGIYQGTDRLLDDFHFRWTCDHTLGGLVNGV
jgi:hypothetical protein